MVGVVRMYLDPRPEWPAHMRSTEYPPVIDCAPEDAKDVRRFYQRQGFQVLAFPI